MNKTIVLKGLEGNPVPSLNYLQELIKPYTKNISLLYWAIWFGVIVYILFTYFIRPLMTKRKIRF